MNIWRNVNELFARTRTFQYSALSIGVAQPGAFKYKTAAQQGWLLTQIHFQCSKCRRSRKRHEVVQCNSSVHVSINYWSSCLGRPSRTARATNHVKRPSFLATERTPGMQPSCARLPRRLRSWDVAAIHSMVGHCKLVACVFTVQFMLCAAVFQLL